MKEPHRCTCRTTAPQARPSVPPSHTSLLGQDRVQSDTICPAYKPFISRTDSHADNRITVETQLVASELRYHCYQSYNFYHTVILALCNHDGVAYHLTSKAPGEARGDEEGCHILRQPPILSGSAPSLTHQFLLSNLRRQDLVSTSQTADHQRANSRGSA